MHTISILRSLTKPVRVLLSLTVVFGGRPGEAAASALDRLLTWQERVSQRHALAALDDRMLKDVGLTRADVEWETGKPFWRE